MFYAECFVKSTDYKNKLTCNFHAGIVNRSKELTSYTATLLNSLNKSDKRPRIVLLLHIVVMVFNYIIVIIIIVVVVINTVVFTG